MKIVGVIILALAALYLGVTIIEEERVARMIREHRFNVGMPAEDVMKSLGKPLSITHLRTGTETWVYRDVEIEFSRGKVIDSTKMDTTVRPLPTIIPAPGKGFHGSILDPTGH